MQSKGHIGLGLEISSKTGTVEDGTAVYGGKNEFFRFASNSAYKSRLNLWIREQYNIVEVAYQSYRNGRWKCAILVPNRGIFLNSFDVKTAMISHSLVQRITRYTSHREKPELGNHNDMLQSFPAGCCAESKAGKREINATVLSRNYIFVVCLSECTCKYLYKERNEIRMT